MPAQPWRSVPLRLPLDDDREITVQPIGWDTGLELRQLLAEGETAAGLSLDSDNDGLAELCMGPAAWAELQQAGVSFPVAFRAGLAAVQYQVALVLGQSSDAAVAAGEKVWEAGLDPEAVAVAIATALQTPTETTPQAETGSTTSTSTDEAPKTPSPASTSTTTSPTTTPPASPTKKATSSRSRGTSSPASGS